MSISKRNLSIWWRLGGNLKPGSRVAPLLIQREPPIIAGVCNHVQYGVHTSRHRLRPITLLHHNRSGANDENSIGSRFPALQYLLQNGVKSTSPSIHTPIVSSHCNWLNQNPSLKHFHSGAACSNCFRMHQPRQYYQKIGQKWPKTVECCF